MKHLAKLPAFSLAEVLAVLVISAATLVTISQLSVSLLRQVKDNEISDFASGIVMQGLEIAKSPGDVYIYTLLPQQQQSDRRGSYAVKFDSQHSLSPVSSDYTTPISTCDSSSLYRVNLNDIFVGSTVSITGDFCLQLMVDQKSDLSGRQYYDIRSRVVYQRANNVVVNEAYGYRREDFKSCSALQPCDAIEPPDQPQPDPQPGGDPGDPGDILI